MNQCRWVICADGSFLVQQQHHNHDDQINHSNSDMASTTESKDEEEDIGTLIYRESQLRKAEAAAVVAAASPPRRTSPRKRSAPANYSSSDGMTVANGEKRNKTPSKRKQCLSDENNEVVKYEKKRKYEAVSMDAQIKLRKEECAFDMVESAM